MKIFGIYTKLFVFVLVPFFFFALFFEIHVLLSDQCFVIMLIIMKLLRKVLLIIFPWWDTLNAKFFVWLASRLWDALESPGELRKLSKPGWHPVTMKWEGPGVEPDISIAGSHCCVSLIPKSLWEDCDCTCSLRKHSLSTLVFNCLAWIAGPIVCELCDTHHSLTSISQKVLAIDIVS